MHQDLPLPIPAGTRVIATSVRDGLGRRDVDVEVRRQQDAADRHGDGRAARRRLGTRRALRSGAQLIQRFKAAGAHDARASAELGGGKLDVIDTSRRGATIADSWQVEPNIYVDAGLRWDQRRFGAATTSVWQPHATIGYDWTKEGRSDVYVTADRASLLDAAPLGAWGHRPALARPTYASGGALRNLRRLAREPRGARDGARRFTTRRRGRAARSPRADARAARVASSVERAVAATPACRSTARSGADSRWEGRVGVIATVGGRWAMDDDDSVGLAGQPRHSPCAAICRTVSTRMPRRRVRPRSHRLARPRGPDVLVLAATAVRQLRRHVSPARTAAPRTRRRRPCSFASCGRHEAVIEQRDRAALVDALCNSDHCDGHEALSPIALTPPSDARTGGGGAGAGSGCGCGSGAGSGCGSGCGSGAVLLDALRAIPLASCRDTRTGYRREPHHRCTAAARTDRCRPFGRASNDSCARSAGRT